VTTRKKSLPLFWYFHVLVGIALLIISLACAFRAATRAANIFTGKSSKICFNEKNVYAFRMKI
jgi:cytochrome bd-type quinol oxidase subunit 1